MGTPEIIWSCIALVISIASFVVAAYFYKWVKQLPVANARLEEVGKLIRDGAFTFLKREYRILGLFAAVVMVLIILFFPEPIWHGNPGKNITMAIVYLFGTALSALAGYVGISIATLSNVRAATAAQESIQKSFMAGFRGGAVMGMAVVGTSLAGAALVYLVTQDPEIVMAFSFGASSLALFAKAGGGIFTKTADIAADLTGKVELGIPEDDPRNPAVIADNVGDNVGDVAGMGADLFDSNVAAMAATIVIGRRHRPGGLHVRHHLHGPAGLHRRRVPLPPRPEGQPLPRAQRRHIHHLRHLCRVDADCRFDLRLQYPPVGLRHAGHGCRRHHRHHFGLLYRR